jgi:hypothetical protein
MLNVVAQQKDTDTWLTLPEKSPQRKKLWDIYYGIYLLKKLDTFVEITLVFK